MMDTEIWITIGAIFVLLLLSAFFSGSETALTAVSRPHMHHLLKQGDKRAGIIAKLHARMAKKSDGGLGRLTHRRCRRRRVPRQRGGTR